MNEGTIIIAIAVIAVFVIASIVIGIINTSKINTILDYSEDGDLVENLEKYYNSVRELHRKLKLSQEGAILSKIAACENMSKLSLSKTGIVNFDAFDDVSGMQSFSLAILNRYNTGFVITSLYGNSSSNSYVRKINEGRCSTPLLDEEQEAINKAMSQNTAE